MTWVHYYVNVIGKSCINAFSIVLFFFLISQAIILNEVGLKFKPHPMLRLNYYSLPDLTAESKKSCRLPLSYPLHYVFVPPSSCIQFIPDQLQLGTLPGAVSVQSL